MKPNAVTCLLLIACVWNLLFGCSQRKAAPLPELEQAEAVMFDRPDSALHILQRMPKPADKEQLVVPVSDASGMQTIIACSFRFVDSDSIRLL